MLNQGSSKQSTEDFSKFKGQSKIANLITRDTIELPATGDFSRNYATSRDNATPKSIFYSNK